MAALRALHQQGALLYGLVVLLSALVYALLGISLLELAVPT